MFRPSRFHQDCFSHLPDLCWKSWLKVQESSSDYALSDGILTSQAAGTEEVAWMLEQSRNELPSPDTTGLI